MALLLRIPPRQPLRSASPDEERVETFRVRWEIGIAVGKRGRPINAWFVKFECIGLACRFSSNANFNAIAVNFRSPFTD